MTRRIVFFLLWLPFLAAAQDIEIADSLDVDTLGEVVVSAVRPMIRTNGAKLTYNVDEDPGAASSTALDVLRKVPQVSVDGDGNIRLNGSQNFKMQLNGQDNPMLKQYGDKILDGMPGNMIVRIEVITEPGAKEDAEGVAGVINIITERRQYDDGYNGQVAFKVDARSVTPSVSGIVKKGGVTLSANLAYSRAYAPQKGRQESTTTYLSGDGLSGVYSLVEQKAKFQFVNGGLNMSWDMDERNLFTAGADVFYLDGDIYSLTSATRGYGPGATTLWSFGQDGSGTMKWMNVSANASFRHNFATEGKNYLVLSYLFNFGTSDLWIDRRYVDLVDYSPEYEYQREGSDSYDRGHTVQVDYANDFRSEHHLMEVGAKGIFRHNTALSDYIYGNRADDVDVFPGWDSHIIQPQDIYAAYASYTGSFERFGVSAGLRYEHTLLGITDRTDPRRDFRNRLNDWVPNAALTWNFSPMSNLRLAYQMRISRPSISQVNPFQLSFSPYEMREGNPDLTSERSHIVSLKYSSFGRLGGGSIGVEYNVSDNAISAFTFLRQSGDVTTVVTSYANIGRRESAALTGLLSWNIIKNMTLNLNGRLAYNRLNAPSQGQSNHGWSGNIGGSWNYTIASVYRLSAYGMWNSRNLNVQGYSSGFYYYGLSASRDLLKDRNLTISVNANNFLRGSMSYRSHTATQNVVYDNIGCSLTAWNVGLSVSWKFGALNAKVKDTGVSVSNDDINSSSNKGQGSSL